MPTPINLKAQFYPNGFYHIVCKSIDGILLFNDDTDHQIFNQRFKKFSGDFFDIWSYCHIPNHTHHVIKIKSIDAINEFIEKLPALNVSVAMQAFYIDNENTILFNSMISRQMNSFLVSYANYINNKYNRKGGVFQKPFKRIKIENDAHLQQAIIYTNANAQKHGMIADYKQYQYSSYLQTLQHDQYYIDSKSVHHFFNGIENFLLIHDLQVAYFYQHNWPDSKLE